tara:strand:+ start:4937 stop:5119 length:183 start_codon:yes stop_codon:yes gene_type:complete
MKVGDMVSLVAANPVGQNIWIIRSLKSDARGFWIQFKDTPDDMWHAASSYKLVSQCGGDE